MKPIRFELSNHLRLVVLPDTQLHLDGHVIIAYNYNIFRDSEHLPSKLDSPSFTGDLTSNPDYYGYITFEQPGKLFTYTTGGKLELTTDEATELIEQLSYLRDNPNLWGKHEDFL